MAKLYSNALKPIDLHLARCFVVFLFCDASIKSDFVQGRVSQRFASCPVLQHTVTKSRGKEAQYIKKAFKNESGCALNPLKLID